MAEDYERLLREHDDPDYWEYPPGFDYAAAVERFRKVHATLEKQLGKTLEAETGTYIQDASFHSQIFLGTYGEGTAGIRFSNFGDMTTIAGEASLPPLLHDRIVKILNAAGYVYVPEVILNRPYTGTNPGVTGIDDWWTRYFDWV